jgi:hypothetical protein
MLIFLFMPSVFLKSKNSFVYIMYVCIFIYRIIYTFIDRDVYEYMY